MKISLNEIINEYIALIDNRNNNNESSKEIDKSTVIFLTTIVKNQTQDRYILQIGKRIDATTEDGFDDYGKAELNRIKTVIIDIVNRSIADQKGFVQSTSNRKRKAADVLTNRIDATFAALSSLPKDFIEVVLSEYAPDTCYDIINMVQEGEKISQNVKNVANLITTLDLRSYPKQIVNLADILRLFENITSLIMPISTKDEDLKTIKELTTLQELDLSSCKNITDAGFSYLKEIPSLTHINLARSSITNISLSFFNYTSSLKYLNLTACGFISDEGLKNLRTNKSIQSLNLNLCSKITDIGIEQLKDLTSLIHLGLGCCDGITDLSITYLTYFKNLTSLVIGGRNITKIGITHLGSLSKIQCLSLHFYFIKGKEYQDLASLSSLKSIRLSHCLNVTKRVLSYLASISSLMLIDLHYTLIMDQTGDIDQDLKHIREINPSLKIESRIDDYLYDFSLLPHG